MMLRTTLLFCFLVAATAAPSQCNNTNILGYSDLETLQTDLDSLTSESNSTVFTICPGTTFQQDPLSEGLRIDLDKSLAPITIQCGASSSRSGKVCTFLGGFHHIWITQVGALTVSRITFQKATRGSVWTGLGQKGISFQDCTWQENVYDWENTGGEPCPTGCAGAVAGKDGGETFFGGCQFLNNAGDSGAVFGDNMDYSFTSCKFESNQGLARTIGNGSPPTGSAITLHNPASALSLYKTCFLRNQAFGPATVLMEDASTSARSAIAATLQVNLENYFEDNRVAQSNQDSTLQWCHNSIYKFVEGTTDYTMDDCIAGTATCCHCQEGDDEEATSREPELQQEQEDSSNAVARSFAGVLVVLATLLMA